MSEPHESPRSAGETDGEELFFPASGYCFGCSRENPAGLHLRFFRDGDGVRCDATLGRTHQGATDIVHGGIQAVLLDEASCAATYFTRGSYVVTGGLNIRYHRPCPTGQPLHVHASVLEDTGRYFVVHAEIRVAGAADAVTSSEGRFYRDARRNVP